MLCIHPCTHPGRLLCWVYRGAYTGRYTGGYLPTYGIPQGGYLPTYGIPQVYKPHPRVYHRCINLTLGITPGIHLSP